MAMLLEIGTGKDAIVLNADKILIVREGEGKASWVTFTNGARESLRVAFSDFEDVPGFHVVPTFDPGSEKKTETLVNLAHLASAEASSDPDLIHVRLDWPVNYDGGYAKGQSPMRLAMSLSELTDLVRREVPPAPGP